MKQRAWIGGAIILLVGLFIIWTRVRSGGGDRPSGERNTPPRAEHQPPADQPRGRDLEVVFDADRAGTLRLEGQVIDGAEDPVDGAMVSIDTNPPRVVVSGADGGFHFDDLVGRSYRLVARGQDGAGGPVDATLTKTSPPVIIRLRPAAVVEVSVVTADDHRPIEGATVELRGLSLDRATSDYAGRARFSAVPAGRYRLAAWAPGYATTHGQTMVAPAAVTHSEELALRQGAAVAGRVIGETGEPIAGAQVGYASVSDWSSRADPQLDAVTTAEDGSFRFAAIAAGTFRFDARHDTLAPAQSEPITVDGLSETVGIEIRMSEGAVLAGRVVGEDGEAIGWATVRVAPDSAGFRFGRARQTFADEAGKFEMTGLERQPINAVALHQDATSEVTAIDLAATRERRDVELVLTLDGRIAGTVVDSAGEPIEGAQVTLRPDFRNGADFDRRGFRLRGMASELSDSGGKFEFRGLPPSAYMVRATPPGVTETRRRGPMERNNGVRAEVGDLDVSIVLAARGVIMGTVGFDDGSIPELFTVATGRRGSPTPFSSRDGRFRLEEIEPGEYDLSISGPDFNPKGVAEVVVTAGETTDVGAIKLTRGRKIVGHVVDQSRQPVANATVQAGRMVFGSGAATSGSRGMRNPMTQNTREATSDETGEFVIYGVGAGELAMIAEHATRGRSTTITIPGSDQSVFGVELVILTPGSLEGTVMIASEPAGSTMVTVQSQTVPSARFVVTTGGDGKYRFDVLAPDRYLVSAMIGNPHRGMSLHSQAVAIVSGQTARVDLAVEVGAITLLVAPRAKSGEIGFAWLHIIGGDFAAATSKELQANLANREQGFSAQGMFFGEPASIGDVEPGEYTACAIPFPAEIRRPGPGFEYMEREGDRLPVFCIPVVVAASPEEQAVTIPVEIPPFVPAPTEE